MHVHAPILVVDDSETDRRLIERELRRYGVGNPLVMAESGLAALDHLFGVADASAPLEPLVVLLDLRLPIIDGADVLRRMRADLRTKHIPVMVLTGFDGDPDVLQCLTLDADYVLAKPLDFWQWRAFMDRLGLLDRIAWTDVRADTPRATPDPRFAVPDQLALGRRRARRVRFDAWTVACQMLNSTK
jgi:CheY-like chemotaxis protein